jgi:type II secretory pathway pseudopilin PulG
MFQLIVSVIAIALVAILAAASIYYGGSAFSSSTAKGNVAALINAGQQISGANTLYKVDTATSGASDINTLVTYNYLSAVPMKPKFAVGSWTVSGGVASIDVSDASNVQVCGEVANQGGSNTGATVAVDAQFGCVTGTATAKAFAYKL